MSFTPDLFAHVIPVLCGVDASLKGCGPRSSIHSCTLVLGTLNRLPIDQKRNRVFSLRNAVIRLACCNACGSACHYSRGHSNVLQDPTADIDVVG